MTEENSVQIERNAADERLPSQPPLPVPDRDKIDGRYCQLYHEITSQLPRIISTVGGYSPQEWFDINSLAMEYVRSGWHSPRFLRCRVEFYKGGYHDETSPRETLKFFVKCIPYQDHESIETSSSPLQREIELHSLMAPSKVVPAAFYWEELGNKIILEQGGDQTAEDRLASLSNGKRANLESHMIRNIAEFNMQAQTKTSAALQSKVLCEWLRLKKPSIDQAIRYFRIYLEANSKEASQELLSQFGESYAPLISMYGEGDTQLVHGDLRRQNIVGPGNGEEWTPDKIKIVDLGSMVLGDPLFGLAEFLTSAGTRADVARWNSAILEYKTQEAHLRGIMGGKGIRFLREEGARVRERFYVAAVHSAVKGLSKMAKLRTSAPQDYDRIMRARPVLSRHDEDMKRTIRVGLKSLLKGAKDFHLNREETDSVKKILQIFNQSDLLR
ncbi:MAG: aminoglycoside phosphotransferase family protein [Nanoarchaeota archaeon]|nr:aminoglycoside phosphotransferase family protein [Nanoarchaeota archaeon]MBU4086510.1 aminoglycoside phosphotransferase family protein [Nanoarchaeota archaeon]